MVSMDPSRPLFAGSMIIPWSEECSFTNAKSESGLLSPSAASGNDSCLSNLMQGLQEMRVLSKYLCREQSPSDNRPPDNGYVPMLSESFLVDDDLNKCNFPPSECRDAYLDQIISPTSTIDSLPLRPMGFDADASGGGGRWNSPALGQQPSPMTGCDFQSANPLSSTESSRPIPQPSPLIQGRISATTKGNQSQQQNDAVCTSRSEQTAQLKREGPIHVSKILESVVLSIPEEQEAQQQTSRASSEGGSAPSAEIIESLMESPRSIIPGAKDFYAAIPATYFKRQYGNLGDNLCKQSERSSGATEYPVQSTDAKLKNVAIAARETSHLMRSSNASIYSHHNNAASLPTLHISKRPRSNGLSTNNPKSPVAEESRSRGNFSGVTQATMLYNPVFPSEIEISAAENSRPKRRNVRISKDPQSVAARHRRERISDRIRILQTLVPGGMKMDTASMLDEAISYVKFLKEQVQTLESVSIATGSFDPCLGFVSAPFFSNCSFPYGPMPSDSQEPCLPQVPGSYGMENRVRTFGGVYREQYCL